MSMGRDPTIKGYDKFMSAMKAAKDAGMFPIIVKLGKTYCVPIFGMRRDPRLDPNDFQSYGPAFWRKQEFFEQKPTEKMLLIPMEARTTASPTGREDYVFWGMASTSWIVPYLAGMYALAVQVNPNITPEDFLSTAMKTGKTIQIPRDGQEYKFGVMLDPQALIEEIKVK